MISLWMSLNISGKLATALTVISSVAMLILPGPVNITNTIQLYENEKWEGIQVLELSPAVQQAIEANDPDVATYTRQLELLRGVENDPALNMVYAEQTRSDGWLVATAMGTGEGFAKLNDLFFGNNAEISLTQVSATQQVVRIIDANRNPGEITTVGGSETWRIGGQQVIQSNADQVQLFSTAIWVNAFDIDVEITATSGEPTNALANAGAAATPAPGGQAPPMIPGLPSPTPTPAGVNVIRNGDFEIPWPDEEENGVAPEWQGYDNGRAHFGWYEELWPEAVYDGERAQLMEIFEVDANVLDRVMAIHQTVDVEPNSEYYLEMQALFRSDVDREMRNNFEREVHWGIDPFGEALYDNVENWVRMDLTEQSRLGSFSDFPDDVPLYFEQITGTVTTSDSNRITLFIRVLKKFPDNVEINVDIDDIKLIGPADAAPVAASQPQPETAPAAQATPQPANPTEEEATLPTSGAVLSRSASVGMVALGGVVVVIIGAAAAISLLGHRKDI